MFIDSYAIIVQRDGDGGDSLQREGMYAFGKWLRLQNDGREVFLEIPERQDSRKIMSKFEIEPGIYVRHPDPKKWYSNPDTTSRDQIVPMLAYCAAYEDYPRLWRFVKAAAKRGFFMQNVQRNGDVPKEWKVPDTLVGHLGLFIRSGGAYTDPLYPLLFVTDSLDLVGTLLAQFPLHFVEAAKKFRMKEPRDVDDNNDIIAQLMAIHFKPTPVSWLNRQLYAMTRRWNYGNSKMGELNPVMGSLTWYHRSENLGNPEMAELYRPLIEQYFSPPRPRQILARLKERFQPLSRQPAGAGEL